MPPRRVLVVDDDPDIIDYFSSFLEDNGYQVGAASSSAAALHVIDEFEPDVVLIDVMMPGRSGLDLLVTLRRSSKWSRVPLVVVTGNDQILQDECQSYLGSHEGVPGPDGVLAKPIDRSVLLAVLRQLCAPIDA
jgi:two-component system OmpR family response regulator/two-component system alkaline phosphatase synthesis response regulator PhoP